MCVVLKDKNLTIAVYHAETTDRVARFNRAIFRRLQHYFDEHQNSRNTFIQQSTYAYRTQSHRSAKHKQFSHVPSYHPLGPTLLLAGSALPADCNAKRSPQALQSKMKARICTLQTKVDAAVASDERDCGRDYDRQVRFTASFQARDMAYRIRPLFSRHPIPVLHKSTLARTTANAQKIGTLSRH